MASAEPPSFDGLLLAGGRSRRFGRDKRLAVFEGEVLVRRAMKTLSRVVTRGTIFVATGSRRESLPGTRSAVVVADQPFGKGPLGGIAAALARTRTGIVVVPCDVPRLRASTVREVATVGRRLQRPAAARSRRGWEPLVAYYPAWALHHVRSALSQGVLAPRVLLDRLAAVPVFVADAAELANVNRPPDLAALGEAKRTMPARSTRRAQNGDG